MLKLTFEKFCAGHAEICAAGSARVELRGHFGCVAVCCSVLQYFAVCGGVWQHLCVSSFGVISGVLQCVVVCCSELQCFAVCCSVW